MLEEMRVEQGLPQALKVEPLQALELVDDRPEKAGPHVRAGPAGLLSLLTRMAHISQRRLQAPAASTCR